MIDDSHYRIRMFEDDDLDLDLSNPLLDVTNSCVLSFGAGNHDQRSPVSDSFNFDFKCPPSPTNKSSPPPSTSLRKFEEKTLSVSTKNKVKETTVCGKRAFEFSFDSDKTDPSSTRDFVDRNLDKKEAVYPEGHSHKSIKRRFPGPAGVVTHQPYLVGDKRIVQSDEAEENRENIGRERKVGEVGTTDEVDSVSSLSTCSTWMMAVKDLSSTFQGNDLFKYDTAWIKKQTSLTFVPHFLCKILKLDLTFKDPEVVLADKSGTIDGTLHRDIPELYSKDVRIGSVILVARVAVLKTVKAEYLSITLNNLASIYCRSDIQHVKRHSKEDFTKLENEFQRQSENKGKVAVPVPKGQILNCHMSSVCPPPPVMPEITALRPPTFDSNRRSNNSNSTSNSKFTFKSSSRPSASNADAKSASASSCSHDPILEAEVQSQHLVASLLSDLDSSDIWEDF